MVLFFGNKSKWTGHVELCTEAVAVAHCQKANIMMLNPKNQHLELKAIWGDIPTIVRDAINKGELSTRMFALGQGVVGKCAMNRQIICVNRAYLIPPYSDYQLHSIISLPLMAKDPKSGEHLEGVMTVTNRLKQNDVGQWMVDVNDGFSETDIEALVALIEKLSPFFCPMSIGHVA